MQYNNNSVFKLSLSVLKHYEENIDGGSVCLFNAKNDEFWFANLSALFVINLLDGKHTVKDIKDDFIFSFHFENNINDVSDSIDNILQELLQKEMIINVL